MWVGIAMGLQEAICGRGAHREQLAAVFLAESDMSLFLQRFEHVRQKRDQAFGTDPIERLPDQHQCLFNLRLISQTKGCWWRKDLLDMIEQPESVFAGVPGGVDKFLQNVLLLGP